MILFVILTVSKAKFKLISKEKTVMKESGEKKVTTLKVFKVIMIIFSIVIIAILIQTIYGWATGVQDTNYVFLASSAASYCACAVLYEEEKKKAAKKDKKKEEE